MSDQTPRDPTPAVVRDAARGPARPAAEHTAVVRQLRPRAPEPVVELPAPSVSGDPTGPQSPVSRAPQPPAPRPPSVTRAAPAARPSAAPASPPPSPTPSASPSIGRRIGKYTIRAPLSEGGMARVYIAQRDGADHICVLKQLLLDLESNQVAAARFRREAHVAAFLRHPNIARVIDAGEDGDTFYIAMDLINGKDLESMSHELLRSHRLLPYPITLTAMVGILDGLAYAHAARDPDGQWMQVVHRDLSPRNMMLTFDGTAKVIDFGMAKGRFDSFKTMPGMVLGTLRFVSPEQALAQPVDARSDLYSVAVVLYEFLSGQMLVRPSDAMSMLRVVTQQVPPPLLSLNPGLPPQLAEVINRGLAKEPAHRWQSAADFRDALIDAAPEWCTTPQKLISDFLQEQFPTDVAHMASLAALGGPGGGGSKTRTVMFEDLAVPAPPVARVPTGELPAVRPTELSGDEHTLTTNTGLEFPRLSAATATVLLRDLDLLDTAPQDASAGAGYGALDPNTAPARLGLIPASKSSFDAPVEPTRPMAPDPSLVAARTSVPPLPPTQLYVPPSAPATWAARHAGELRGALIMTAVFAVGLTVWAVASGGGPSEVVVVESGGAPVVSPGATPSVLPRATAAPVPAPGAVPAASASARAPEATPEPRRRVEASGQPREAPTERRRPATPEAGPDHAPSAEGGDASSAAKRAIARRADEVLAAVLASTDPQSDGSLAEFATLVRDASAQYPDLDWKTVKAKRLLLTSGELSERAPDLVAEIKKTLSEAP